MKTESLFPHTTYPNSTVSLTLRAGYYLKQLEFEESIEHALKEHGLPDLESVHGGFVTFDLSNSYWYDLGTSVWLITLLHKLRKLGNDLQLLLPEPNTSAGRKLWGFLHRWRFFECLRQNVDLPVNLLKPSQVRFLAAPPEYAYPDTGLGRDSERTLFHGNRLLEMNTLRFDVEQKPDTPTAEFIRKCSDIFIAGALSFICGWELDEANRFTKQVIVESVLNASLHAQGSFSVVAMRIDDKNLTLAVADNGVGIPANIRSLRPELSEEDDAELIRKYADPRWVIDSRLDSFWIKEAVREGVGAAGRIGDGLHYLKSNILGHLGELRIRSGKACVDFSTDAQHGKSRDQLPVSPGTMLRIIIPRKSPSASLDEKRRRR